MNKLLIIDTFYFLHRSFHAYPLTLMSSKGEHTNIVFGLAQSVMDMIEDIEPTHILCAWESEEQPSFRKELYPQYQITRAQLEPLEHKIFSEQFPRVIELLNAFNIPRISQNGFEGDDVVGTIATLASLIPQTEVVIATSDQDMMQLINEKITIYRPARLPYIKEEYFTPPRFIEKYGFNPINMIDYKALRGDPSDNIPGVKGVGEKTATKLIQEYGNLDEIYSNLENIQPESLKQKLVDNKSVAYLSKQLATIITNIPIDFNFDACQVHDFDIEKVRTIFEELEFKSLSKRLDNFYGGLQLKAFDGLPEF